MSKVIGAILGSATWIIIILSSITSCQKGPEIRLENEKCRLRCMPHPISYYNSNKGICICDITKEYR